MGLYRKKPLIVEAMQLPRPNMEGWPEFMAWVDQWGSAYRVRSYGVALVYDHKKYHEGVYIDAGQWLVRPENGPAQVFSGDAFEKQFDLVDLSPRQRHVGDLTPQAAADPDPMVDARAVRAIAQDMLVAARNRRTGR